MKLTDWQGQEYGVGDTIIYAGVSGRSPKMVEAVVVAIDSVEKKWISDSDTRLKVMPIRQSGNWSKEARPRGKFEEHSWGQGREFVYLRMLGTILKLKDGNEYRRFPYDS